MFVSYPGMIQPISARYAGGIGISPGRIMCQINPQPVGLMPATGDMTIADGYGQITLYRVAIDQASMRLTTQGQVYYLEFVDRRWDWQYSVFQGAYNIRNADGSFVTARKRTVRQLATLLFQAMGESNPDVSALANDGFPLVEASTGRADLLLLHLCYKQGCLPTLDPAFNRAKIVRLGQGDEPPVDFLVTVDDKLYYAQYPSKAKVVGRDAVWQGLLQLEPVAYDSSNGRLKRINDISTKPAGGWENAGISLAGQPADTRNSMYYMYRVKSQVNGSLIPPGYNETVSFIEQYFPLYDKILETGMEGDDEIVREVPAKVYGRWQDNAIGIKGSANAYNVEYEGGFKLLPDLGVVVFPIRMYRLNNGRVGPADLYLKCSYGITELDNLQKARYSIDFDVYPEGGGGIRLLEFDDLKLVTFINYNQPAADPPSITTYTDNRPAIQAAAEVYKNAWLQANSPVRSGYRRYQLLRALSLSGKVRQIEWWVDCRRQGNDCAGTAVHLNTEGLRKVPTFAYQVQQATINAALVSGRQGLKKVVEE